MQLPSNQTSVCSASSDAEECDTANEGASSAALDGWPDLDQEELHAFQAWYIEHKVSRQTTLCQTINMLLTQVEEAEAANDMTLTLSRHAHAKDLKARLDSMDDLEYMRQQSWNFKALPSRTS